MKNLNPINICANLPGRTDAVLKAPEFFFFFCRDLAACLFQTYKHLVELLQCQSIQAQILLSVHVSPRNSDIDAACLGSLSCRINLEPIRRIREAFLLYSVSFCLTETSAQCCNCSGVSEREGKEFHPSLEASSSLWHFHVRSSKSSC